jgi:hypothetical protein
MPDTLDPNKMNATLMKMMGLWPPVNSIGYAIAPYVKRMKADIEFLDIGVGRGESIVYLSESAKNIKTFFGLSHTGEFEETVSENMTLVPNVDRKYDGREVDVVAVSMIADTTPELLEKYYSKVRTGGIFVGDCHDQQWAKESLVGFRRLAKIGTPVQVINRTFWFWYKR